MIKLFDKQEQSIKNSTKRINIWEGPVRSGKTVASIYRWIHFCFYGPQGQLAMIGKTERTLAHNIIDPLQEILGNSCRYIQGKGEIVIGDRTLYVFGANDRRSEEKIRGGTWAGCYGDELTLWPEEVFKMVLSRMSIEGAKFFGTTNTDSPFHWLKKEYLDRKYDLDLNDFHFQLDENTFLNPSFVSNLKREYTGLWYKRFIQGLWVLAEGVIYDMWDEEKSVVNLKKRKFKNYLVGIDYGTLNPCTFGLFGFDKEDEIYLIDEYYYDSLKEGEQKTDLEYAQDFSKWLGDIVPLRIYIDPSAVSFKAQLRKDGFKTVDANNSVIDGIRLVGSMLKKGIFKINHTCRKTIEEFSSYVWDIKQQESQGKDVPLKKNDHAMDRNRYALYTHFTSSKYRSGAW